MSDPSINPQSGALTGSQLNAALSGLPDWRYRRGALVSAYVFAASASAIDFIAAVGAIAEERNHHPDVDWRYNTVFLTVSSHEAGGEVTGQDTGFATAVSTAALRSGGTAEPRRNTTIEVGIDTKDPSRIAGFWTSALGYELADNGDLVDPEGRNPTLWFQVTDTPSPHGIHLDRHVPLSSVEIERGNLRPTGGEGDGARHPAVRVYADPDGNRMCLCTEVGHMPGD